VRIVHSSDTGAPNSKGVAVVLNRETTNANGTTHHDLIPGRALLVSIPWHTNKTPNILAVYAPNDHAESAQMWKDLKSIWSEKKLPRADILLGDFNLVEDTLDQLPSHPDDQHPVKALRAFKNSMHLIDGWRSINPDTKAYTYTLRSNDSHLRIDRIYALSKIMRNSANWQTDTPGAFDTEHRMASVQVVHAKVPFMGKGRYAIPVNMCKDKHFIREAL
jgi:exonuclease III